MDWLDHLKSVFFSSAPTSSNEPLGAFDEAGVAVACSDPVGLLAFIHHRHRTSCSQCLALDHASVDVAGEDDGEFGPGFASPDQPDGGFALELDDGWLGQLLLVPQGLWLGAGCPGRG